MLQSGCETEFIREKTTKKEKTFNTEGAEAEGTEFTEKSHSVYFITGM